MVAEVVVGFSAGDFGDDAQGVEPAEPVELIRFETRLRGAGVGGGEPVGECSSGDIINAEDHDTAMSWARKVTECIHRPIEARPFFDTAST